MNLKRPAWGKVLSAPFKWFWKSFDIRDLFLFGGLGAVGYGIYLEWGLSWAMLVPGGMLMLIGYLMKDK
jgi:hypothetical protein